MAEDKKKDEIAVIEINEEFMKQKLKGGFVMNYVYQSIRK